MQTVVMIHLWMRYPFRGVLLKHVHVMMICLDLRSTLGGFMHVLRSGSAVAAI